MIGVNEIHDNRCGEKDSAERWSDDKGNGENERREEVEESLVDFLEDEDFRSYGRLANRISEVLRSHIPISHQPSFQLPKIYARSYHMPLTKKKFIA